MICCIYVTIEKPRNSSRRPVTISIWLTKQNQTQTMWLALFSTFESMETNLKIVTALCFARIHKQTQFTEYLYARRPKICDFFFWRIFFRFTLTLHFYYFAILLTLGIEFLAKNSFRPALRAIIDTILTDDEIDVGTENEATTISYWCNYVNVNILDSKAVNWQMDATKQPYRKLMQNVTQRRTYGTCSRHFMYTYIVYTIYLMQKNKLRLENVIWATNESFILFKKLLFGFFDFQIH